MNWATWLKNSFNVIVMWCIKNLDYVSNNNHEEEVLDVLHDNYSNDCNSVLPIVINDAFLIRIHFFFSFSCFFSFLLFSIFEYQHVSKDEPTKAHCFKPKSKEILDHSSLLIGDLLKHVLMQPIFQEWSSDQYSNMNQSNSNYPLLEVKAILSWNTFSITVVPLPIYNKQKSKYVTDKDILLIFIKFFLFSYLILLLFFPCLRSYFLCIFRNLTWEEFINLILFV